MSEKIPEWMVQLSWTDQAIHRFAKLFNDKILSLEKRIAELEKQQDKKDGIKDARQDSLLKLVYPTPRKRKHMWITNGVQSKKILISEAIPEGWHKGRSDVFGRQNIVGVL